MLELVLTRNTANGSSVTLTRNAKGDTQIEVTVRQDGDGLIPTADAALDKAREIYDVLRTAYPPPAAAAPKAE